MCFKYLHLHSMGKALHPVTIQILCIQPDFVYGDLDRHLSYNTIAERKKLKAATRANAVSVLAMDVDTNAQPLASYPSATQNDFNLSMAHDHDSNMAYDPSVNSSSVDVQAGPASHKTSQVTYGVYGCVCF